MKRRKLASGWMLGIVLLPGLVGIGLVPGDGSATLDKGLPRCSGHWHPVICDQNHTDGGPIGCFNSICEAIQAGAYNCQKLTSTCEPGLMTAAPGEDPAPRQRVPVRKGIRVE